MSTQTHSPRVLRKRARARAGILDAARDLVSLGGVAALTIEAVAQRADVSKPSVYYYFESKEELVRSLAIDGAQREGEALRAALAMAAPGSSVPAAIIRGFVDHHCQSIHRFRVEYIYGQVIGIDRQRVDAEINPGMNALFQAIEDRLRQDADAGRLRDGLELRRVAVGAWMSAVGVMTTLSLLDVSGTELLHRAEDIVGELCKVVSAGVYR